MLGDNAGSDIAKLHVGVLRLLPQRCKRFIGSAAVAGHHDSLGLLDDGSTGQRFVQVVDQAATGEVQIGVAERDRAPGGSPAVS